MIDAGDRVVTRWTGSGTHQADLMSISPTGKQVQVTGIWIHRFANLRLVRTPRRTLPCGRTLCRNKWG